MKCNQDQIHQIHDAQSPLPRWRQKSVNRLGRYGAGSVRTPGSCGRWDEVDANEEKKAWWARRKEHHARDPGPGLALSRFTTQYMVPGQALVGRMGREEGLGWAPPYRPSRPETWNSRLTDATWPFNCRAGPG